MGVIVMPFVDGSSVMAKMISGHWEFGYCRDRIQKVQSEPYITRTPHDRRLVQLSKDIQAHLGFRCEIEYIISADGGIHVVQAKDISQYRYPRREGESAVDHPGRYPADPKAAQLSGAAAVCDGQQSVLHRHHLPVRGDWSAGVTRLIRLNIDPIIASIEAYQADLEAFALRHQRYAVLGLAIQDPVDLYQIANHYLDDMPDLQAELSRALHNNLYQIDIFLSEADTLIAKDKFRINLCSHDAYGIDTVRNPLWTVYWYVDRQDDVVRNFQRVGFKTGDTVGIDINVDDKPTVYRL